MVDRSRVAEFTGSCACLRPAPQHLGIFIPAAPGPEGRVRTSRRMSAKKKSHDAMFFVNTASPAAVHPAGPAEVSSRGRGYAQCSSSFRRSRLRPRLLRRMRTAAPANCVCQEKIARCDVFREHGSSASGAFLSPSPHLDKRCVGFVIDENAFWIP